MEQVKMILTDIFSFGVVACHFFVAAMPTLILLLTVVLLAYQIRYYRNKNKALSNNCDSSSIKK